jgi:hypothetical protein
MTRRFAANNSRVSLSKAGHRKNRRVSGAQSTDATFPIGQPSAVTAGKKAAITAALAAGGFAVSGLPRGRHRHCRARPCGAARS